MKAKSCVFLYVISDRKRKDTLEDLLHASGGALVHCVYGRGWHESRNLLDYLGFGSKKGKVILTCLIEKNKSLELIDKLNNDFGFTEPCSGIAFTVPVDTIVY